MNRKPNRIDKTCIICRGKVKFLVSRLDKYDYNYCSKCSLILSNPLPTDEDINKFYEGFLFRKPIKNKLIKTLGLLYNNVKKISKDIKTYVNSNDLLDYGGGIGTFSYLFHREGFIVTLAEVDSKACDYAREKFGKFIEIVKLNLENNISLFSKKYDVIFCNQVIEHIKNLNTFLTTLKVLLKPGGLLIITTPNHSSVERFLDFIGFMGYIRFTTRKKVPIKHILTYIKRPWSFCDPPRHIYCFNPTNLKLILQMTGFTPIKIFTEYSTKSYFSHAGGGYHHSRRRSTKILINSIIYTLGVRLIRLLPKRKGSGSNLVAFSSV